MPASVVLPLPGGPQSTMLGSRPAAARSRRVVTTRSWPTSSSNVVGLKRDARGASGARPGSSWGNREVWSDTP